MNQPPVYDYEQRTGLKSSLLHFALSVVSHSIFSNLASQEKLISIFCFLLSDKISLFQQEKRIQFFLLKSIKK